ncbi:pyrimidine 5'-nucleotidase [Kribbella sp. NBC_01505]|uniref:pyrimidine 5'-nucleotidase n=1 Tax=Kribbella sp. NBC_01505 TaxID=2903580 RepID=UPI003865F5AE
MLSRIDTWILDLDNTLYPPSTGLADQMNVRIRAYLANVFDADEAETHRLQAALVAEHGTTLRGLMNTRGIDPHDYLAWEHTIDYSVLVPDPALTTALAALPGRKLLFTNGSAYHADQALARLGLAGLFDGVFDILAGQLVPKPYPETYQRFNDQFAVTPESAVFCDDLAVNLQVPEQLGMATVWVSGEAVAGATPYEELGPRSWRAWDLARFLDALTSDD